MTARKALCSIGAGPHAALLEVSRPTFEDYARRHGYELVVSTHADGARPPAWAKVPLLRELLDGFELVLWIDADAVVVDPSADVAHELRPEAELALVQHRVRADLIPNTGVMLLRAGATARALLDRLWGSTSLIRHPWWDNAAMLDALGYSLPPLLAPGWRGRASRLAQRLGREPAPCRPVRPSPFLARTQFLSHEWNSIHPDPAEHPRIVHCLGTPVEQRLRDMRAILADSRPPAPGSG